MKVDVFFQLAAFFHSFKTWKKNHETNFPNIENNYILCSSTLTTYYRVPHVRRNEIENLIWINCANVKIRKDFFLYPQGFRDVICKRLVWRRRLMWDTTLQKFAKWPVRNVIRGYYYLSTYKVFVEILSKIAQVVLKKKSLSFAKQKLDFLL